MVRCFVAIPLPEDSKEEASKIQSQLKEAGADVKWVRSKDIHLTLKFMGEVEEEKIGVIIQKLSEKLCNEKSFTIQMEKIGSFPSLNNPRVIWIGIEKGKEGIMELQKRIEEVLKPLGFPEESRSFHPHFTLGRVRSRENIDSLMKSIKLIKLPQFTPIEVNRINLFQSILKGEGAEYKIIGEFNLLSLNKN